MFYYKQTKPNSCGAAAMLMALKKLRINSSEDELYKALKIDSNGTLQANIRLVLNNMKLKYKEYAEKIEHINAKELEKIITIVKNNHIKKLISHINDNQAILVNMRNLKNNGHFVMVVGYTKDSIIVHDPDPKEENGGPNIKILYDDFLKRWISGNSYWKKWWIVIG